MSKALITESHLTDIANAIIAKGGATGPMLPSQMAAAIEAIKTGGGDMYPRPEWPDIRKIYNDHPDPTRPYGWIALLQNVPMSINLLFSGSIRPYYTTSNGDSLYGDRYDYRFDSHEYHWVIGRGENADKARPYFDTSYEGKVLWMHFVDGFNCSYSNTLTPKGTRFISGDYSASLNNGEFKNVACIDENFLKNASATRFYDTAYNNPILLNFPNINTAGCTYFSNAFDGCTSLVSVMDELDMTSATVSNNMFSGCISLVRIPTRLTANGSNNLIIDFSASQCIDIDCIAMFDGNLIVGGMAYNINDLSGSPNPPTVMFNSVVKTMFGDKWDAVKSAFTHKGWLISPA